MAKYREGQSSTAILDRVIRPLVERGYMTWGDAGYQNDPKTMFPGQDPGIAPFSSKVEDAVKRFQHDNGIHNAQGHAGGVVGNRTLAALGQQVDPLEVQTLLARNIREHAAKVSIQNNPDAKAVADRIVAIRQAYPHLGPKVTAALGLAGYGASDDATKQLAATRLNGLGKPFWQTLDPSDETLKNEGANGNLVDTWAAAIQGHKPSAQVDQPTASSGGGGLMSDLGSLVKGASRATFSALETPYQGLVGAERNAVRAVSAGTTAIDSGQLPKLAPGGGTPPAPTSFDIGGVQALGSGQGASVASQTSGGIALGDIASGKNVDLGTGFFPGGQVEQEQSANANKALSIAGHAATPGRLAAALVTQPGTEPYNVLSGLVDAASILYTDPANIGISALSDVREARNTLTAAPEVADEATGLVNGIRRTILPQSAERWLNQSRAGQKIVARLATPEAEGGPTFLETLKAVNGDSNLAAQLHNASSSKEVLDALRPKLGITMTAKPELPYRITQPFRDITNGWRITGQLPEHFGDLKNMDATVHNFDNWLRNGKVSLEDRNTLTKNLVTAQGREDQYQALKDGAGAVEDSLVKYGVHPNEAKGLTKLYDTWDDFRHYMTDEAGQDISPFYVNDGKAVATKTPAHFIDFLNRTVPFPNVREIRQQTDALSHVRNAPGAAGKVGDALTTARNDAQVLGDHFNNVWKPLALARIGFPLRVIAESQAAMAMAGHESMFSHPIHFITQLVSSPKTDSLGRSFSDIAEKAARTGDYNEYADALAGWGRQYITNSDEYGRRLKGFHILDADMDAQQFPRAWHERLARLSTDPIVKKIVQDGDLNKTKDWFYSGEGATLRREMIAGPEDATYSLSYPQGASNYIDVIANDIDILTQGDEQLRNALGTGKATIGGKKIKPWSVTAGGAPKLDSRFGKYLSDQVAAGQSPQKMIGQLSIGTADKTGRWNQATNFMFDHLLTQPTNKLTYSPLFREAYYRHMGTLAPFLNPSDREKLALQMEANKVDAHLGGTHLVDDVRRTVGGDGVMSLKDADALAKKKGLDTVKSTIHDLSHRSQFFDIFRNIAPFGEAWKQVLTRWAKITYNHPETLRKFQVGVNGARGAGFFYTDPASGEELFNYPASKELTNALFGVPVPLAGQVSGLNIAGNGLPGVGPLVQIGAGALLPHTPAADTINRFVSPYGDKSDPTGNPLKTLVDYTVPSWMGKAITAITGNPESDVGFAHSVMAMQRYLMTTGKYGNSDVEQRRLIDDATADAHKFYLVRALASLTGPAAPIPQPQVRDQDGNLMMQLALSDEYRKAQDAGQKAGTPYDEIDQQFLDKYGENIYSSLQPFTKALVESLPVTKSQIDWERSNPDLTSKYPNVYGFFTPPSKKGEKFDQQAYDRQVKNGQRQQLSPRTWRRLANDRLASHLYYQARNEVGEKPSAQDRSDLKDYHAYLLQKYPGFESDQGVMGKATTDELAAELTKAANDPKLRNTRTGKTIRNILEARQEVGAEAAAAGINTTQGWQTSNRTLGLRQDLAGYYDHLRKTDPTAGRVLDSVFRNDTRGT